MDRVFIYFASVFLTSFLMRGVVEGQSGEGNLRGTAFSLLLTHTDALTHTHTLDGVYRDRREREREEREYARSEKEGEKESQ